MMNLYFEPFIIPFCIGVVVLFGVMWTKFISWISRLPKTDKRLILKNAVSSATFAALWEVIRECLLHMRIRRVNLRLWYMHMSLAFGWFLLIVVGRIEGGIALGSLMNPPYVDVFFRKYFPYIHIPGFGFLMDLILLFILSGLGLAVYKRFNSRKLGMKRTTRLKRTDRVALISLWCIFPVRLLAESFNSALFESGSFLTGSLGDLFALIFPTIALYYINNLLWWCYSVVLGTFFIMLPFSRYLHIFAEIPLIFLRAYGIRAKANPTTFSKLQIAACSRCGICIDPCQLAQNNLTNNTQSVYFLRNIRDKEQSPDITDHCLLCGRCEQICPVGIELNTIRISSRHLQRAGEIRFDYSYFRGTDLSAGEGKVGYFAGCMGQLSPKTAAAMKRIFQESETDVWYADSEGSVCCGRPQKMAGNLDAARQMTEYNTSLFEKHGIRTLVTSCPICLKTFREDYRLPDIEVLHHSEYIARLLETGRLKRNPSSKILTYHDPCELGRGSGIYDDPRKVISRIGILKEAPDNREHSLCCGSSLGNTRLSTPQKIQIAKSVTDTYEKTGAEYLVTSCPLCKKALGRTSRIQVIDLSEALFLE